MVEEKGDLQQIWESPIAWFVGGVTGIIGFMISFGIDPITSASAVILILIQNATDMFTAFSIIGFTIAPELGPLPAREIQILAIVFGAIVVAKILDSVWESIKERRRDA